MNTKEFYTDKSESKFKEDTKNMDFVKQEILKLADELGISKDMSEWDRMNEVLARLGKQK